MKRRIKLTEGSLHRAIKESIKKVIKENAYEDTWKILERLEECMDDREIIHRIIGRLGPDVSNRRLNDIMSVECPNYDDED